MNEDAFAAFYRGTAKALWRYLHRIAAGEEGLADEILQEAYVRLLRVEVLPEDEKQRKAYLYRTATHAMHDRWRSRRREAAWLTDWLPFLASTEGRRVDLRLDVDSALAALKPRQRALLWLAYVDGYTHREIAEILGLREASVKVLLHRARQRFEKIYDGPGLDAAALEPRMETSP